MSYTIYALIDPRDNQVRYIGATNNPVRRLKLHLQTHKRSLAKSKWLTELSLDAKEPILQIIEVIDDKETADQREMYWITHYLRAGANLINIFSSYKPKRPPVPKQTAIVDSPKITLQVVRKEYIDKKPFYSPEEVATYYGVTADTIRRLCRDGQIPGARQIGKQWRIPRSYLTDDPDKKQQLTEEDKK